MELTAKLWAKTAGLTPSDAPRQREVFWSEANEYVVAKSPIDKMDALCDEYFVLEVLHALGAPINDEADQFKHDVKDSPFDFHQVMAAYQEVIRSNFTKFCKTKKDATASTLAYAEHGFDTAWRKEGKFYVIYSAVDQDDKPMGKILKGINYEAPQLAEYV
jgi:hypothetical protein